MPTVQFRVSDEAFAQIEARGGNSWAKEQILAILAASSEESEPEQLKTAEETELVVGEDLPRSRAAEQAERERFGYTKTETRTKAERDEAAKRMLAFAAVSSSELDELPPDIAKVWGHDSGQAKLLINVWGLDRFRQSQVHRLAVQEGRRETEREPVRRAFVQARSKA